MTMNKTKEIRWFFPEANRMIRDWFDQLKCDTVSERTDFYLNLAKNDIGVKLRDDLIEVKHLCGTRAKGCLSKNAWGYFECWTKWSFKAGAEDSLVQEIVKGKTLEWTPVKKVRRAVQLVRNDKTWEAYPLSDVMENACQIEYTQITIEEFKYFTFGLEWLGSGCCEITPAYFSKILGKTKMALNDSMGYPEFLVACENLRSQGLLAMP